MLKSVYSGIKLTMTLLTNFQLSIEKLFEKKLIQESDMIFDRAKKVSSELLTQ